MVRCYAPPVGGATSCRPSGPFHRPMHSVAGSGALSCLFAFNEARGLSQTMVPESLLRKRLLEDSTGILCGVHCRALFKEFFVRDPSGVFCRSPLHESHTW